MGAPTQWHSLKEEQLGKRNSVVEFDWDEAISKGKAGQVYLYCTFSATRQLKVVYVRYEKALREDEKHKFKKSKMLIFDKTNPILTTMYFAPP